MDGLLNLWQLLIPCSLGNGCYTLGFLIFIIDERNLLYYSLSTHRKIIKAPLLHQNSGPRVLLSLSPFLRLIPWSAETHLAHSPAWASKTISRRHPVPSPHLGEGAWCLRERCKFCVKDFIGFLHKLGSISLFLSFAFLSLPRDCQVPVH